MDSRWSSARNAFLFISVISIVYFLALPASQGPVQTVTYGNEYLTKASHEQRHYQPQTPISVQEIEEVGNFSLWANGKFGDTVQYGAATSPEVIRGRRINEPGGASSGEGKITLSAGRTLFIEDLEETSNYESSDSLPGGNGAVASQETQRSQSLERIRKEKEWFSLSRVSPRGGNTLPNYLLHGSREGILPADYQRGVVSFLHHNKAAGSSIKLCLQKMVTRHVMKNHSLLVVSSKILTTFSLDKIMDYDAFVGGYTFGLCEHVKGANCSYFTVLRDPYDRVLSSYFYCMLHPADQLCGPIMVGNFTIQQWAIFQGSYFFHQLLMDKSYCNPNTVIGDLVTYEPGYLRIPPGTENYLPKKHWMCWLRQRIYLNTFASQSDRELLLENVLENLERWFSVIGLTEAFDVSLKMLSVTYDLPFYRRCRGKVMNKSPTKTDDQDQTRARLRQELEQSPEVAEALSYDIRIYERGREIFERQKKQLDQLENVT